jgi:hypothetical protein
MFKKKYIHETTGDVLTFSEQISWKVQGIIRNWFFVVLELIIGIAMIGQTKRDALIIRHILKLEKQEIEHLENLLEGDK